MPKSLKDIYEKWNFPNSSDPKAIDTKVPSKLETDGKQLLHLVKQSPKIYGTDIVRIASGGQVDKDKVRSVVGKIAGKGKLGGFVKKLIAPTAYKPGDLIADNKTIDPLYEGVQENSSFGGVVLKSVKQFLKDNKTPQQIAGNALGAGLDLAQKGLKALGNKALGKLGIGKIDSDNPVDVRKPSSSYISKRSLIFPSTVVIHQNKNVGGVVGNQEQNYFVDGIAIDDVFNKRITIGTDFKSIIDDTAIAYENDKVLKSDTYFNGSMMLKFSKDGYEGMKGVANYNEYIKAENTTKSILLKQRKDFNHNIRNKFLSIDTDINEVLVFANVSGSVLYPKKTKLPSDFPLIGTLDGKAPDPKEKKDIYGQNNGAINSFSQSLLDSGRRVDQSYFGSGSINVDNQITKGTLVSNPNVSTASFAYTNNKDIYEGDSSTIGDVEKKIATSKVLRQTYKTLQPQPVKITLPTYSSKPGAFLNKSKQSILSKAPSNLNVVIAGISFPSTITSFQDSLTPNWDSVNPIGAGVPFYVFNNVEREISFKMLLYAENASEVAAIKDKYNAVGKAAWSKRGQYGAYGNITSLTIGNLISQVGFISAWTLAIDDMHPWDIDAGLPMVVSIDITFKVATNNDTETYNLYGFSPDVKTENSAVPGAKDETKTTTGGGETKTTTGGSSGGDKTTTIKLDSKLFNTNTQAASDSTRNVPMEQLKADLTTNNKTKKTPGSSGFQGFGGGSSGGAGAGSTFETNG